MSNSGELPQWRNELRGAVTGSAFQAGVVHGDVHLASAQPIEHLPLLTTITPPLQRLAQEPTLRGRAALIAELWADLNGPARPAGVHVLHGLGGVGKSMVAVTLADHAHRSGVPTWWVHAGRHTAFLAGMHALAVELGANADQLHAGMAPDLVWRRLNERPGPWLLVIDNADDVQGVLAVHDAPLTDGTGWVRPVQSEGTVLITTRDGGAWEAAPWLRRHPVDRLGTADGVLLLEELTGGSAGGGTAAGKLVERLGGLPLALRLAGSYLTEVASAPAGLFSSDIPRTYADYQRQLNTTVRGPGPPDENGLEPVRDLWEVSLDLLAVKGLPLARPLLRLLSGLGEAQIPGGTLLRVDVIRRSPLFEGLTALRLWRLIHGLQGLSLIDLTADEKSPGSPLLTLHPLVRDACRAHEDVGDNLELYLDLLTTVVSKPIEQLDPRNPASWRSWMVLSPHCSSPLDLAHQHQGSWRNVPATALRPLLRSASYLRAAGKIGPSAAAYRTAISAATDILGPHDAQVLSIRHDLCRVWYDSGKFDDARAGFERTIALRRELLGDGHPDTLTSQHYLARVLRDDGRLEEAELLFAEVLRARGRLFGPTHHDTLTSRNSVADLWRVRGRYDEAELELRDVAQARAVLLGAEHPATLVSQYCLARVDQDRGELTKARGQLVRLAAAHSAVLGSEHPRTLNVLHRLGENDVLAGRLDRARKALSDVLATRVRVLGQDHPSTRATSDLLKRISELSGPSSA